MKLVHGIHEVRLFRPNGVSAGYFDNFDDALRAVEDDPSQYKAAYITLNPINLPGTIPLNPQTLTPSKNTAGDTDIVRRVRLLLDFDPPRPAYTNSTDAEKQSAREQADAAREYLRSRGWPDPLLGDSGNGWHLNYQIDLPNNEAAKELIYAVLARLKNLFPMVDAGNGNASRLCKLYGSWARKGSHSEERPWRRSAIVEPGSDVIVTESQLRELLPAVAAKPEALRGSNVKLEKLLGCLEYYSVPVRSDTREVRGGWQLEIECPWVDEHSSEARRDTVVSFIAGIGFGFKCLHSHCIDRHWREFYAELEKRNPGLPPYFGKLPKMTHSDIARQFVEEHDDFVRIYDQENATGVWMPGCRWQLGDPGDALLRRSIRSYLDELYERYPAPEANKRDYRLELKNARFVSGVMAEVKPWLPPKSEKDFDCDPEILPLPNGLVADLRRGQLRVMRREDCQTKRIPVTPVDVPPERWDRFLREITCGDDELAAYIVRLMVLCITGLALHLLIILYGTGRNGKGVWLRLIEKMLGRELFAIALRPEDIEYHRGGEERNKRMMGRLKGKRLAYTGETVSGNLDWTLLKTLTGGDTLAGAKLYQDTEGFTPSHTLILTTNDRPKLPATIAFKERLRFVPFNGDFSKSRDFTLEDDLAREMPGILWQLIKAAPAVFINGDEPPDAVREATDDVMEENDVAKPFIEECLTDDKGGLTQPEMRAAILQWLDKNRRGLILGENGDAERIMQGVRTKYKLDRFYREGKQLRGFVGVRLVTP
jgi:P4 family phage/plasmid primase-like protien